MLAEATLLDRWEGEYKPLLGDTDRWEGFSFLIGELLKIPRPVIIETGALREPGNWRGDGQSTHLWNWVVKNHGGMAVTVDARLETCWKASRECPQVSVVCQDSVTFLRGWLPYKVDLLYLDSEENPWTQVAELGAIWDRLPVGCLIASDDAPSKAKFTRKLLPEPILDSYICVWKKS